jgi:O-antigen/teichoic acid export membrane protein
LDVSLLRESLVLSYPLTPRIFLTALGDQFDKYLIGLLNSLQGVGIYAIAQRVSVVVFSAMTALGNVFVTHVYEEMFARGPSGGRTIGVYLTPFIYASAGVALMVSLFSEEMLYLIAPVSYHGATAIINVLALYYALLFFRKLPQLAYAKKTQYLSFITFVTIALNAGLNILFIPRYGAMGAAAGTLLAGILTGIVAFRLGQRFYRIEFEYGRIVWIFGLLVLSALLVIGLREAQVEYGLRLGLKLLLVGVYVWLGTRVNAITREHYDLLRTMLTFRMKRVSN